MILLLGFLIGVIAGLRALTAPAMVSWAARTGVLHLDGTWLAFLGYRWTPWIFTLAAVGELINDKLPNTPSRKVPPQFAVRILTGALSGAAITASSGSWLPGLFLGALGAVAGTLGGAAFRASLVRAIGGRDLPIALLEDAIAVIGGFLIVRSIP
jgi:uncharacterized membrane protein